MACVLGSKTIPLDACILATLSRSLFLSPLPLKSCLLPEGRKFGCKTSGAWDGLGAMHGGQGTRLFLKGSMDSTNPKKESILS